MPKHPNDDAADLAVHELSGLFGQGRQIQPFSERIPGFDLATAYDIAGRIRDVREARGENPVGRKIGFTNEAIWGAFGISGPVWNYMFDSTVYDLEKIGGVFSLTGSPEPRIEPEIVFHLARAPQMGMSDDELFACVDWIAHGFEIVLSIFPGWKLKATDAVAGYCCHRALLLGKKHTVSANRARWQEELSHFTAELDNDRGVKKSGGAASVLGGPVQALGYLVKELSRFPACEPLRANELISTGTLTDAMPIAPNETWSSRLQDIALDDLQVRFR